MDYSFGLEQMLTETTFVRDEELKRYHYHFENLILSRHLFVNKHGREENQSRFQLKIDRGALPLGSEIFQQVLAEFVNLQYKKSALDKNETISEEETEQKTTEIANIQNEQ